jgi:hypothetical protein
MNGALEAEDGFVPDLIDVGLEDIDLEAVCCDRALMGDDAENDGDELDEFDDEDEFVEPAPPVKPGRNDPCWCGSGKKYKKCHLQADEEESRAEDANAAEDEFFAEAWRRILVFARQYYSASEMDAALSMYFDQDPRKLDNDTITGSGYVVWYTLDYRAKPGAGTLVEEYLRRRGARLAERERKLVESWRDGRLSIWEVARLERGRGAEIRDTFAGDTLFVEDVSTSRNARPGDLLLTRAQYFEGRWVFLGDGLIVPPAVAAAIREAIGGDAGEVLRSRFPEWRRLIVNEHADSGDLRVVVNAEGDPLEFSSAEYEVADAAEAAARLRVAGFVETTADAEDGKRTFGWLEEGDDDAPRRAYGHVEIAGGSLRLECNSRARLSKGRRLVEEACATLIRHRGDTFKPLRQAMQERP